MFDPESEYYDWDTIGLSLLDSRIDQTDWIEVWHSSQSTECLSSPESTSQMNTEYQFGEIVHELHQ